MVRELEAGETARAALALLDLRPAWSDEHGVVDRVDRVQRPAGYRVVASFADGDDQAAAAAGFRVMENLAWGRTLYVDDIVTRPEYRRQGHADALVAWLDEEARRLECDQIHLDSNVGPHRQDAHRFYLRHGLRISSFHFSRTL